MPTVLLSVRSEIAILYSSYFPVRDRMSLSPRVYERFVIGLCLFTITLVRNTCKRPSREPFIYYRPALIVDSTVRQQWLRRIFETVK